MFRLAFFTALATFLALPFPLVAQRPRPSRRPPKAPAATAADISGTWLLTITGHGASQYSYVECRFPRMMLVLTHDADTFAGPFYGGSGQCVGNTGPESYSFPDGAARAAVDTAGHVEISISEEFVLLGAVRSDSMMGETAFHLGSTRIDSRWTAVRPRP